MSEPRSKVKMVGVQRAPKEKWLVVGLDFGTTYSGITWQECYPDSKYTNEDDPDIVRGWPSDRDSLRGTERDQDKAPSRLLYDKEGNLRGWGFQTADGDVISLELFKLAIVPDNDLPPYLRDSAKLKHTKKQIQDLGLNPTQVIEMYLTKIWAHAQSKIKRAIGEQAFQSIRIHVVITIPAIWRDNERDCMMSAAATSILESGRKGLTTYEFLSEPEAAVQAYEKKMRNRLHKSEILLVVDMGGGTTDIIPYENIGEEGDGLKLKEAAPGTGGLYGATNVDEAFENLFLSKLPEQYENLKTERPGVWRTILLQEWEDKIKRNFEWHNDDRRMTVQLSNLAPHTDIILHEDEIRDVFESSVMPGIIRLIKEQIEAIKKAYDGRGPRIILPVGGFGRCPYIVQRLEEEFGGRLPPGKSSRKTRRKTKQPEVERIEVHAEDGEMPWIAVARGACKFGIRALLNKRLVAGRYARESLGFMLDVPGSAEEGGIYVQEYECYMIRGAMRWIVRKGDLIPSDVEKSTIALELPCDIDGTGTRSERSTFYTYSGDTPPDRFDLNDEGFKEYGVMEITATKPIEELPKVSSNCGERPHFPYDLKLQIVGSSVQVTATSAIPGDKCCEVSKLVLPKLETA